MPCCAGSLPAVQPEVLLACTGHMAVAAVDMSVLGSCTKARNSRLLEFVDAV